MLTSKIVRTLPVALSEAERLELGDELARNDMQVSDLAEARRVALAALKEKGDLLSAQRSKVASMLRSGTRDEAVDCEKVIDLDMATMTIIRLDTGEVWESRTLSAEQLDRYRQTDLKLREGVGRTMEVVK